MPRVHGAFLGHDGVNDPATGSKTLALRLGAEWVFWQTGLPDVLTLPAEIRGVMPVLFAGLGGIVLLGFVIWKRTPNP